MLKAKSLISEYALIFSGDPSLRLPEGETERTQALKNARETGNWDPWTRAGEHPSVFWVRPMPGTDYSWLLGEMRRHDLNGLELYEQALRLVLRRIDNFGGHVVKLERVDGHELATKATIDAIYSVPDLGPQIVLELGAIVFGHAAEGISPLA